MPDAMVVSVPPYEGEYPFDLNGQPLSTLEWRWVKRISGYLPLTVSDGFAGGDPDLFVSWAVIAMVRAGKITKDEIMPVADLLAEAPFDGAAISFKGEVSEEDEADPPTISSPDDSKPASGESSRESTEPSPESVNLSFSGIPDLDTGSDSDRLISAR